VPPAALLNILQKGLQYTEAEITIGEDGNNFLCTSLMWLLHNYYCLMLLHLLNTFTASSHIIMKNAKV
jgi:hypothetical protein